MKRCGKCGKEKSEEDFPLTLDMNPRHRALGMRKRYSPCKECRYANTRRWFRVHGDPRRGDRHRNRRRVATATQQRTTPERCMCGMPGRHRADGFWFCSKCFAAMR